MPGEFRVEPGTVLSAVPQWDTAADDTDTGARGEATCVDLGHPALTAALGEFDGTWSGIGSRLAAAARAVGPALTTTVANYLDTDDGAASAMATLTSDITLQGPR